MSQTTCLSILASLATYKDYEVISQQVPAEGTYSFVSIDGMSVLNVDIATNQRCSKRRYTGPSEAVPAKRAEAFWLRPLSILLMAIEPVQALKARRSVTAGPSPLPEALYPLG